MKIVVIGLLPKSENLLVKKYPDVKFRFVNIDANYSMPNADYCILMQKFINHSWQDKAFNALGRDRVLIVYGSKSHLYSIIENLIEKEKKLVK